MMVLETANAQSWAQRKEHTVFVEFTSNTNVTNARYVLMIVWHFQYRLTFSIIIEQSDMLSSWRKFLEIHPGVVLIDRAISDSSQSINAVRGNGNT